MQLQRVVVVGIGSRAAGRAAAILATAVVAAAAAASASAHHVPHPAAGGLETLTPQEAAFSAISSQIAARQTLIVCNDATRWSELSGLFSFEPDDVAGFVPVLDGKIQFWAELHPRVCELLDELMHARPQSPCVVGSTQQAQTKSERVRVRVRKRVRGKLRWVSVWRTRSVTKTVNVPVHAPCAQNDGWVQGVWTLTHESVHLANVADELAAECAGMQLIPFAASRLGPNATYASEIGVRATQLYPTGGYYTPDCRDGGPLDIDPTGTHWPRRQPWTTFAPTAMPSVLDSWRGPVEALYTLRSSDR